MNGWELTTTVLVGVFLFVIVVFSVLRPSSRIRLGVFLEREIMHKDPEPVDEETAEWPARKDQQP